MADRYAAPAGEGWDSLTPDEVQVVLEAARRGPEQPGEALLERAVEWAHQTRVNAAMLEMVLDRRVVIGFDEDGEVQFRRAGPDE